MNLLKRVLNLKLLKILSLTVLLSVSSLANASLMLTEDDYITFYHEDLDLSLDWAWASNYNVQTYISNGEVFNELLSPTVIDGWREASTDEFKAFTDKRITDLSFKRDGGGYKNAVKYFNTNENISISGLDFRDGYISSEFRENVTYNDSFDFFDKKNYFYDTFYVRTSSATGGAPKPIPEPLSIIIFATAIIALHIKRRKKST